MRLTASTFAATAFALAALAASPANAQGLAGKSVEARYHVSIKLCKRATGKCIAGKPSSYHTRIYVGRDGKLYDYSATKAALMGLAKASALDLGPFGITVNCIGPGPFLTDLPMNLLNDAEKKEFSDRTALNRWGEPRELAGPAIMLASEAGSYITGEMLLVDGGAFSRAL